jgi:hypothetical protein
MESIEVPVMLSSARLWVLLERSEWRRPYEQCDKQGTFNVILERTGIFTLQPIDHPFQDCSGTLGGRRARTSHRSYGSEQMGISS